MVRHVWKNYESRAFGRDELKPVSGRGVDSWGGIGQTLVDSLDTLWMMGFHEEFHRAATWAETHLDFDKDLNVNYFETTIRHLGGLLSAYIFSRRPGLLLKAMDLAQRLAHVFPKGETEAAKPEAPKSGTSSDNQFSRWLRGAKNFLQQVFDVGDESGSGDYAEYDMDEVPAAEDLSGQLSSKKSTKTEARLPLSDVNLRTGKATDLAGYLSLADSKLNLKGAML